LENFYIEGVLSYARNQYDDRRHITIGGLRRTASSDDDGDAYSTSLAGDGLYS
jgi:hypothetical protein